MTIQATKPRARKTCEGWLIYGDLHGIFAPTLCAALALYYLLVLHAQTSREFI
jgi:hypothetical protein